MARPAGDPGWRSPYARPVQAFLTRVRGERPWPVAAVEGLLVAFVALVQIGMTAMASRGQQDEPDYHGFGVAGVVLLAIGVAALPLRRQHPVAAMAIVFGSTATYWSLGYARGPVFLAMIICLVTLVLQGHRRAAIATLLAGFVVFPWAGYLIDRAGRPTLVHILALTAWLIALIAVSEMVRDRRAKAEASARSHAEELRRRATEERLHIAREIHDVVAHNMSLISIQAGVALHLLDKNPDQARASLATIKDASKEALVELRSVLGVLRQVDEPDGDDAPRQPVPGLRRLADLVDRSRAAGLDVRLEVDEGLDELPRQVDLAAFRIVQESLTNVAKHAHDQTAVVRLRVDGDGLAVDVLDEGSGGATAGPPVGGNGIVGMQERAAAVGGRLEAGPRPGRGFAVRAWLPLGASAGEDA
jgi:signal transduction histidine kinase